MPEHPVIPMLPEEVPQQRITLVVDIPERPDGFAGYCDYVDPMPDGVSPKGSPRNVTYLGSVEWAGSPRFSRFDSYYLGRRGPYWLLWNYWLDENDWKECRQWTLYGYAAHGSAPIEAVAANLLLDTWAAERDRLDLGHFFLIDEPGLLSIDLFSAIARRVWPAGKKRRSIAKPA